MKIFEADLKRLNGNIVTYKEKKPEVQEQELEQRNSVISVLRETFKLFRRDYDQQTKIFEQGNGVYSKKKVTIQVADATNDEFLDRDGDDPIVDQTKAKSKDMIEMSEFDFDKNLDSVQKTLE